jgi:predicted RNA methylase
MKTRVSVLLAGLAALSLAAAPLLAHHAFSAEFDANKQVILKGNVTKMEWINPHAWLHIDVKEADGKVTAWDIELGPPNALLKRGWDSSSVPVGLAVVVEGYQAKDGAKRANGREVTLPNGKKLFAGSPGTGAPGDDGK